MSRNQVNNPDDLRKTVKNGKNKRKKYGVYYRSGKQISLWFKLWWN